MIQLPIEIGDIIRVGRFKNKKITVKEIGVDENNHPTVNGRGILKVRIEKLMPKQNEEINEMNKPNKAKLDKMILRLIKEEYPLGKIEKSFEFLEDKKPIKVKFQEKNGRHWIIQEESENVLGSAAGYETKDTARQSALILGFHFEGVEDMQGKVPEISKLTKAEPVKYDKPEEVKLDKEKELKLEILKIAKRVIKEELSQKTQFYAVTFDPKHPDDVYNLKIINARNNKEALWKYAKRGFGYEENNIKQIGNNIWTYRDKSVIFIITSNQNITAKKIIPAIQAKYKLGEEFSKKTDNLKEDFPLINLFKSKLVLKKQLVQEADIADKPELEAKARRFAELANKMKEMEAELKNMEKEYTELDQEFRPLLESIGTTKDTFIRAGKLLIKIERAGYEKGSSSYKTGFDYLYSKVNGTMKQLADEALEMTKTVSYVKSKIAVVQGESVMKEESWFGKIKNFITSKIKKLFGTNQKANAELDKLEAMF